MTPDERDRLSKVEQKMADTVEDVREMKADVKQILTTLNEAKGGWKSLMWVGGLSGTAGAVIAKISAIALGTPIK